MVPISIIILTAAAAAETGPLPASSEDLFQLTRVWTLHLAFTAEEWEALEPKGGGSGGPFGAAPGPGGPPRSPNPPAPPGPAMFIAPTFLSQGDRDRDGKLSREEFLALGERWFEAWDKEKSGRLDQERLRAGINSTFAPPAPPGGGGPGGGRPMGMNLQGPEGKRNGLSSMMGIDFQYVHADLEFEGRRFKDVAVRYKGNGTFLESRGSLKRSFKIDLDRFAARRKLAGVSKLNLHSNVTDPSSMNEPLAFRLHRDAGVPAPRTAYARVYLTVPGKHDRRFLGLYTIVEDVDRDFIEANFQTRKGTLFKPVGSNLFADLGEDWAKYRQTYDPKFGLTDAASRRIIDLCRLLATAGDAELESRLGEFLDLDEVARYLAVMVWLSDLDGILGPGQNLYAYLHPRTGKLSFIPWDQDHSWGQFPMRGTQEQREDLSIRKPWQGDIPYLTRLFKVEAFKKPYLARLEEFSRTIFKPQRIGGQVDEIAAAIRPVVKEESEERLARFEKVIAGETAGPAGGFGGFQFGQPPKPIKPFVMVRAKSVVDQLSGDSPGQTLGEFGFGGPRTGGGGGRGPGPGAFGPGNFLAGPFMTALDDDHDGVITHQEFTRKFGGWFESWTAGKGDALSDEGLRAGINRDLAPAPGAFGGFGRPRGGPGGSAGGAGSVPGGPPGPPGEPKGSL
jgi:spore coat protein H